MLSARINVDNELSIDYCVSQRHYGILMVGEEQAVYQSVGIVAVNLCATKQKGLVSEMRSYE